MLSDRDSYKSEVAPIAPPTDPLNVDTIQQILEASWPSANKDASDDYSSLLSDLNHFGITTVGALQALISKWHDLMLAKDIEIVERIRRGVEDEHVSRDAERIEAGVYFTHEGLTRVALSDEFPEEWQKYTHQQLVAKRQESKS